MSLNMDQRELASSQNLNTLPDDVLFAILRYCDIRSLLVLVRVSQNLRRIANDDSVWRGISQGCINVHSSHKKIGISWKELCRVSWNWVHGRCRDRCVIKFKAKLMPAIQLGRTRQLYVAQGADVVLYQNSRRSKSSSFWQQLMTFSGHQSDVSKFVVRGCQLVTCSTDKLVCTWNLKTGLCDGLYSGHTGSVRSVDCLDDVIVSGSRDKTVKVWSQQTKACIHTIFVLDPIWSVCLNPSNRIVASGSSGHSRGVPALQIWDINSGRLARNMVSGLERPGAGVLGMKWETPYTLLSCGYDTFVKLWDTRVGHSASSCVLRWEDPHDSVVYCIDSDDKWMVVSGTNRYGVVRVWDKRFGKCIRMFYAGKNSFSPVYSLKFNRTSLFIALAYGVRTLDFTV